MNFRPLDQPHFSGLRTGAVACLLAAALLFRLLSIDWHPSGFECRAALEDLKPGNLSGFSSEAGELRTDSQGEIRFRLETPFAFAGAILCLDTAPNARYAIYLQDRGREFLLAEDSFFHGYSWNLTPHIIHNNSLTIRITATAGPEPAGIIGLQVSAFPIPTVRSIWHILLSLGLLAATWITIRKELPARRVEAELMGMALAVVLAWFPAALPHFFLVNTCACSFLLLRAALHTPLALSAIQSASLARLGSVVRRAEQDASAPLFLWSLSALFLAGLALGFRFLGLDFNSPPETARSLVHTLFGLSFLACLCALPLGAKPGRPFSVRILPGPNVAARALVWIPAGILLWLVLLHGLEQILINWAKGPPGDAMTFFRNRGLPWSGFFLATGYRAPLLTYLNKGLYGFLGLPPDVRYMTLTALLFCLLTWTATTNLARRLLNSNAALLGAGVLTLVLFLPKSGAPAPMFYLFQGLRLFPYAFLLALGMTFSVGLMRASTPRGRLLHGAGLGIVLPLSCLLRPETMFIAPPALAGLFLLRPGLYRHWLFSLFLMLVLFSPYLYSKYLSGKPSADNLNLTVVWWRNYEFVNTPGVPTSPEVERAYFSGPKVDAREYFFSLHSPYETAVFTFSGIGHTVLFSQASFLDISQVVWPPPGPRAGLALVLCFLLLAGLANLGRREHGVPLLFAVLFLLPNAFMLHLGSPPRHMFHVWPCLIVLSVLGGAALLQQRDSRKPLLRPLLLLTAVAFFLSPGLATDLYSLNHVQIHENNRKNNFRGDRFQTFGMLAPLPDAPLTLETTLFLPKGDSELAFSMDSETGCGLRVEVADRSFSLQAEPGKTTQRIPLHTGRVGKEVVRLVFDHALPGAPPEFVTVSSLPKENAPRD